MAVRLLTWLDRGRDQLQDLLVVCGLPLAQARLAYSAAPPLMSLLAWVYGALPGSCVVVHCVDMCCVCRAV